MINTCKYQPLQFHKKLVSLLLVLMVLFNVCGYYLWFNLAQNNIRNEIKAQIRSGIQEKDLAIIEINKNNPSELKWLKAGKEFIYHGEMYDVVKSISTPDGNVYYCIHDVKEKKLISEFARKNDSTHKARRILAGININFTFQTGNPFHILENSNHEFFIPVFEILSKIKEVADPPPKGFLPA
jgi:hypothetical protein